MITIIYLLFYNNIDVKNLIIGCGNIGFRHFQSILKLSKNMEIILYDKEINNYQIFLKNLIKNIIKKEKLKLLKVLIK